MAEVVATLPGLALAAAEIVPSLLTGTPMSPQAAITALPLVATLLADAPRAAAAIFNSDQGSPFTDEALTDALKLHSRRRP